MNRSVTLGFSGSRFILFIASPLQTEFQAMLHGKNLGSVEVNGIFAVEFKGARISVRIFNISQFKINFFFFFNLTWTFYFETDTGDSGEIKFPY